MVVYEPRPHYQAALERVWQAFVTERQPPAYKNNGCRYLAKIKGRDCRCAVGWLLPPSVDHAARRVTVTVDELADQGPKLAAALQERGFNLDDTDDLEFLLELQRCHDDNSGSFDFNEATETSLRELAAGYRLEVPK